MSDFEELLNRRINDAKAEMECGRHVMLASLNNIIHYATETKSRIESFSKPTTQCHLDDHHQWIQAYMEDMEEMKRGNQQWCLASSRFAMLMELDKAYRRE